MLVMIVMMALWMKRPRARIPVRLGKDDLRTVGTDGVRRIILLVSRHFLEATGNRCPE